MADALARPAESLHLSAAGERVELLYERAVWWPARRTLLAADLHLGKEETFRRSGIPLPRSVLEETLARLTRLIERFEVERIVILGDLVHARDGLSEEVIERVAAWRRIFAGAFELVSGNHDRAVVFPDSWAVRVRDPSELDPPFAYRHDPAEADPHRFTWCGHLHPTVRLASATDRLALPCFVIGPRHGVLPAFTAFARGPGVRRQPDERLFALAEGRVVEIPS